MILIRNPFDALVAEWNRHRGGHTAVAKSESFFGKMFTCVQSMSKPAQDVVL